MTTKVTKASGVKGFMLRSPFHTPVFRVYSEDRKTFKDYDIIHSDLEVAICGEAAFYEVDTGNGKHLYLDHSPDVLGKKNNEA